MKSFALLLALSLCSLLFAQSNNPCGATTLTAGATCNFVSASNVSFTDSGNNPTCAFYSGGPDAWFSFVMPASGTVDVNTQGNGGMTDAGMAVWSGPCTGLTQESCNDDSNGLFPEITFVGTPGTTYYISFWQFGGGEGSIDICLVEVPVITAPSNDDPCSAAPLSVGASCVFSTQNTTGATDSGIPSPGCGNYLGGDVWFSFVVPASGLVVIDSDNIDFTDGGMAVYSGTCGSLTLIECDDDDSANGAMPLLTIGGQTPGATLFIRFWEFGNNDDGDFSICIQEASPPSNDEPCAATALPVGSSCSFSTFSNVGATASTAVPAIPNPSCGGYSGGDVWFTATVPASGNISIATSNISFTDGAMALYSGTCTLLVEETCDDNSGVSSMPSLTAVGLTPGQTVWIRFWEVGNNSIGDFDICASDPGILGPCGNAQNNDFCSDPALLVQGTGSFTSNTSALFSDDIPPGITQFGSFCGSIENNSWYSFTASGTSEVFDFTNITNCTVNTSGVQAAVYDITNDLNGCCTGATVVSNCYSPGNTTDGTVTATGLTIGNTYVLMVDGNAGADCEFTVPGWTATGILPVNMKDFSVLATGSSNEVRWETASEQNSDYILVQKSTDGINFETVNRQECAGNSSQMIYYEFSDFEINNEITYYRLKQYDFDGKSWTSVIISVERDLNGDGSIKSIYPNPSNGSFTLELSQFTKGTNLKVLTVEGRLLEEKELTALKTTHHLSNTYTGLVMIQVENSAGEIIGRQKLILN